MTLVLNYAARTDMGLVRGNNEDAFYAGPRLLALADGMGGYEGGEVASQLVVSALVPLDNDQPSSDILDDLRSRVELGNEMIADSILEHPHLSGMGTTLVAMLFDAHRMGLVSVGDSRAYLLRKGEMTQITRDDSFVQDLVDRGRITPEEASVHPKRSLITNALMGEMFEPHLKIREVCEGDRYLICSDGLSDPVSFDTLRSTLAQGDPQQCADRLVDLALRSGGPDNITIIVADVVEDTYGSSTPILGGSAAKNAGLSDDSTSLRSDSAAARAAAIMSSAQAAASSAADSADKAGSAAAGASQNDAAIPASSEDADSNAATAADAAGHASSASADATENSTVPTIDVPSSHNARPTVVGGGSSDAATGTSSRAGATSEAGTSPEYDAALVAAATAAGLQPDGSLPESSDTPRRQRHWCACPRRTPRKRMSRWGRHLVSITAGVILVIVLVTAGIIAFTWNNSYYVGVNEKEEILIYHGINNRSLGPLSGKPDSALCEHAIHDVDAVPESCVRLTLKDFTPALRADLVSEKVFHSQKEARAYLTRAVSSGLLPTCSPHPLIIWGADGQPVDVKDYPDPCRKGTTQHE